MSVGGHQFSRSSSHIATSAEPIARQVLKQLLHRQACRRNDVADHCSDNLATGEYPASSGSSPHDSSVAGRCCSWTPPQPLLVRLCSSARLASPPTTHPHDALWKHVPNTTRHSTSAHGRSGSHIHSQSSSQVDVKISRRRDDDDDDDNGRSSLWLLFTLVNDGVICFDVLPWPPHSSVVSIFLQIFRSVNVT